jgi:apolipoprotein D and lipocalin family protein
VKNLSLLLTLAIVSVLGLAQTKPLQTVPKVDLDRYLGTWYEIATIPQRFQKGCTGVTATYSLRPDGKIDVFNQCHKDSLNGKHKQVHGRAWVVDKETNAKLKVQFFWPFSGAYWIIELDSNYQYAVVGHPNRNYLWILCRTPQMDEGLYGNLLKRLQEVHGYDLSMLKKTPQKTD